MRQSRTPPHPPRAASPRERPAPVFRDFVRTLEKLEGARSEAPRPAREGTR
jgi:hypothetical protein